MAVRALAAVPVVVPTRRLVEHVTDRALERPARAAVAARRRATARAATNQNSSDPILDSESNARNVGDMDTARRVVLAPA